ncbi:MAG: outer membrane lipoprotein carrier protein LolA [Myxococcota bacterium]|nr:outer membrane lipoprotein carrier protein LolA [Myxococcota bacterium]
MRSWSASLVRLGSAIAIVIVIAIGAASSVQAQRAPTLDELLAQFRGVHGMELRFREEKRIALLRMPAISEGTVHYARPGRLVRRITRPNAQIVLIDGDELRMREGGRTERIDLAAQPVVRSFVDTFSQLLGGDRAALERAYRVQYTPGEGARWTLVLTPSSAPLDRFLREIRFEGEATTLRTMLMTETSGDTTTTTFSNVDTTRRYTPAESARLFTLD